MNRLLLKRVLTCGRGIKSIRLVVVSILLARANRCARSLFPLLA
jgi:hypothetical protein